MDRKKILKFLEGVPTDLGVFPTNFYDFWRWGLVGVIHGLKGVNADSAVWLRAICPRCGFELFECFGLCFGTLRGSW